MFPMLTGRSVLPEDAAAATLIGRAWVPGSVPGPAVVVIRDGDVFDITSTAATVAALLENKQLCSKLSAIPATRLGGLDEILANSTADARDKAFPYLLAPVDLQAVKACGVTFAVSMLERVIEEQAKGVPAEADKIRNTINLEIGGDLAAVRPGSEEAERLKQALISRGLWSQYIEVGIGPYAEVFTKAQPMSAVGPGAEIGIHPESTWNNPEPEVVLIVNSRGEIAGATLGNDVNLRDFEGRSALLLGRAKDNNASAAIGPFIRLFDDSFGLDEVRSLEVQLRIEGADGFTLADSSSMAKISRDPAELVRQTISRNHQYPDGLALFTGTMFAPTQDRDKPGAGFTHKIGDLVTISAPSLGSLVNRVNLTTSVDPWEFGTGKLMHNLALRGLLS